MDNTPKPDLQQPVPEPAPSEGGAIQVWMGERRRSIAKMSEGLRTSLATTVEDFLNEDTSGQAKPNGGEESPVTRRESLKRLVGSGTWNLPRTPSAQEVFSKIGQRQTSPVGTARDRNNEGGSSTDDEPVITENEKKISIDSTSDALCAMVDDEDDSNNNKRSQIEAPPPNITRRQSASVFHNLTATVNKLQQQRPPSMSFSGSTGQRRSPQAERHTVDFGQETEGMASPGSRRRSSAISAEPPSISRRLSRLFEPEGPLFGVPPNTAEPEQERPSLLARIFRLPLRAQSMASNASSRTSTPRVDDTKSYSLETVERNESGIPVFFECCLDRIYASDLGTEGLFRISGDKAKVEALLAATTGGQETTRNAFLSADLHDVTAALKQWLRELSEPLIPSASYKRCINSQVNEDPGLLLSAVEDLPTLHAVVVTQLFQLLVVVASHHEKNKMSPENLGVVFAPSILRPSGDDPMTALRELPLGIQCVKQLVDEFDVFFESQKTHLRTNP